MHQPRLFALLIAACLCPPLHAGGLDTDGDGLDDALELSIGTDPYSVDSDCDGLDDLREVGAGPTPLDNDGDGVIDALESAVRDSNLDGLLDEASASPPGESRISCARFHPFVVAMDDSEASRVEVRVMGSAVSAMALRNQFPVVGVRIDAVPLAQTGGEIVLYDDGSHGDRIADDGIWSRGGITSQTVPLPPMRFAIFDLLALTDTLGSRVVNLNSSGGGGGASAARLGQLDPALRRQTTVVAPGLVATRHALFLIDPLADVEVRRYLMLRPPVTTVQAMTAAFYARFPDAFDFLLIEPGSPAVRGFAGLHTPVSNAVQGIGRPLIDQSAAWGSAGRLQSAVFFNHTDAGPFVHELTHRWGNALSPALGFGQCQGGHWGIAGVGFGAIGGFDAETLIDHGDGTFSAALNRFSLAGASVDSTPLNPLDLYLAGLLAADEVPSFQLPLNAQCGSLTYDSSANRARFAADGMLSRSVADIVAVHGPRLPAAATAQHHFRAAWLVTVETAPNPSEAGWFDNQSRYLGLPTGELSYRISFEQATAGLATLETGLFVVFADGFGQ